MPLSLIAPEGDRCHGPHNMQNVPKYIVLRYKNRAGSDANFGFTDSHAV